MYTVITTEIRNRLQKLDLSGSSIGDQIMFCPDDYCLFQYPPSTAAVPECPNCRGKLRVTRVAQDLIDLVKGRPS